MEYNVARQINRSTVSGTSSSLFRQKLKQPKVNLVQFTKILAKLSKPYTYYVGYHKGVGLSHARTVLAPPSRRVNNVSVPNIPLICFSSNDHFGNEELRAQ